MRILLVCLAILCTACVVYDTPVDSHPSPSPPPYYPVPAPRPPPTVEIRFFYDALDPYGDWMRFEPYGWVWVPNAVDPFWRPYTFGRWVWTDWGWMWVSSERWGWATYHYGRWVRVRQHGWVWVPGDVWGPGWVAWRRGSGVVGWAPLPPDVRYRAGAGLDWGGGDIDVRIALDAWCFLDEQRFADNDLHRYAYPVGRNATVIRATKNVTKVRVVDRRIVNEGIDRAEIERAVRRPVPVRRVTDQEHPQLRPAEVSGNDVRVYRPQVTPKDNALDPPRGIKQPPPETPDDVWKNDEAQRKWARGWNEDWQKLQKEQKRDEPPKAAGIPPPPAVTKKHQEENREAAENAYQELTAEQERAKRKAERAKSGPPGQAKKGHPKGKDDEEPKKDPP